MTWLLGQIGLALLLALLAGWFLGWFLRAFRDQDSVEDLRQTMLATKDVNERELSECRRRVEELEAEQRARPAPERDRRMAITSGHADATGTQPAEAQVNLRAVSTPDAPPEAEATPESIEVDATADDEADGSDGAEATIALGAEEALRRTLPYSDAPPQVAAVERERRREAEDALRRKTAAVLSLQAEIEALRDATSGKASEIAALEEQLAAASAAGGELEAAQARSRELSVELERMRSEAELARRDLGAGENEVQKLKGDLDSRDKRLNELRNRLGQLETARAQLEPSPGADPTGASEVQEMRRALQRQIERNRKQEAVHRAVVRQLKSEHEVAPEASIPSVEMTRSDELSRIRGIGAGFARALHAAGVSNFGQIGAWNQDDVERFATLLGTHAKRIRNDRWIEQARELSQGGSD
ncbi:MAG: hypothetical protein GKS06_17510 [Acidobacteria bacterium]|nr:hypothetical protein [Acidobacteriota bacterium]